MELINATRMAAAYTMGMEPSGRELLVVVVKGTFHLPKNGEEVRLHEVQLPLVMADTFTGAPGLTAPYYEVDFAPRKHYCDVLLQGSAYAPDGRPAARVPVGIRIGNWMKIFAVVGDRYWQSGFRGVTASAPIPFTVKPISYDVAFGGTDTRHMDPQKHAAYMRNPVGRGYHRHLKSDWIDGGPLPNTEELKRAVVSPDGDFSPMAFGPIGRGWEPRLQFAGTYDKDWLDNHFPFLPLDFDEKYYQAAPIDQQLSGSPCGMPVSLVNLSADGTNNFLLPRMETPVHIFTRDGKSEELTAVPDTLLFEPDAKRFAITWRATWSLRNGLFDVLHVLVGRPESTWQINREQTSTLDVRGSEIVDRDGGLR